MADRVRRERVVSIQAGGESDYLDVLVDEISPERRVSANQELVRLSHAFDRLTPRCREVVWLRRVIGLSQKEVAAELGVTQKAVEKRLAAAGRLIAQYMQLNPLASRKVEGGSEDEPGDINEGIEDEHEQGKPRD
jgi:RNA polymerase sigma-70 factor (ECF subfamily)